MYCCIIAPYVIVSVQREQNYGCFSILDVINMLRYEEVHIERV
jgi:hypothetical protein